MNHGLGRWVKVCWAKVAGRIVIKTLAPIIILTVVTFAAALAGTLTLLRGVESGYEDVLFGRVIPDLQHMSKAVLAGEQASLAKDEAGVVEELVGRIRAGHPEAGLETFPAETMREHIRERRVRGGIDKLGSLFFVSDEGDGVVRVYRGRHSPAGEFREVEALTVKADEPVVLAASLTDEFNAATARIDERRGKLADLQLAMGSLQALVGDTVGRIQTARDAIRAEETHSAQVLGTLVALVGLGGLAVVVWAIYQQVRAIHGLGAAIEAMSAAQGDEGRLGAITVTATARRDELGILARGIEQARLAFIRIGSMDAERAADQTRAAAERRTMLDGIAAEFDTEVGQALAAIERMGNDFHTAAKAMSDNAEAGARQTAAAVAAAKVAAESVMTVTGATRRLSDSVVGVGGRVATSTRLVGSVRGTAEDAQTKVTGLSRAAERIGEVAGMIGAIAAQTNLLALNATIEAARAGDAGKGFAVVAGEVKGLSVQTAQATNEVSLQVGEVQAAIAAVVAAIATIADEIGGIDEIAGAVVEAVEEQKATAGDIADAAQQAADGTNEVNREIERVGEAVASANAAAAKVVSAADSLLGTSETIKDSFAGFLKRLRTAS